VSSNTSNMTYHISQKLSLLRESYEFYQFYWYKEAYLLINMGGIAPRILISYQTNII
jgi:hypothetical protein